MKSWLFKMRHGKEFQQVHLVNNEGNCSVQHWSTSCHALAHSHMHTHTKTSTNTRRLQQTQPRCTPRTHIKSNIMHVITRNTYIYMHAPGIR